MWCEIIVGMYLESLGWSLVAHRKKISDIEVDLIYKTKKKQIVLIEVKSIKSNFMSQWRWTYSQKNKFEYVLSRMTVKYPQTEIFGVLAMVDFNKLSFYHLDET